MIKLIVFDLDGTLFLGESLRDGTLNLLNQLRNINVNFVFYTNTSSKSTERVLNKLQRYSINTSEDSIYTNQLIDMFLDYFIKALPRNIKSRLVFLGCES